MFRFQHLCLSLFAASLVLSACSATPGSSTNTSGATVVSSPSPGAQTGNTSGATVVSSPSPGNQTGNSSQNGGFPDSVKSIALQANQTVELKGNLDQGQVISDLSWASSSSVACFPATQNSKFKAKHNLFYAALPPHSILKIKLIPDNPEAPAMSLYAYQIGANDNDLVPDLSSVVTCEADHINDRPVLGKVEDGSRSVRLNAINNPYRVVIGVTGLEAASGGYTLQLSLEQ